MEQHLKDLKWYVLYTRPKFEKKICMEMDYLHFENYLPLRSVIRRWSDRIKKIEEPLFSSYIFVKTDHRKGVNLLQIPGVVKFITTEGKPAVVSSSEIDRIRLIETQGSDIQSEQYYSEGDLVMIKQGAFAGMKGVLIRRMNKQGRFLIKLPLLKQAVSIEVSVDDLMEVA